MRFTTILAASIAALPFVAAVAGGPKAPSKASAIGRGRAVYEYNCATCHGAGPQMPGTDALAVKYKGQNIPPVLEQRRNLTAAQIEYFTRSGVNMMPHFRKTEVSDQQLKDMTAYLLKKK